MLIAYHTCDHCGKHLDGMKDYQEVELDMLYGRIDLCAGCYAELIELIKDFVRRKEP